MEIDGLWHSAYGYCISIKCNTNFLSGNISFSESQSHKIFKFSGFMLEKASFHELAFIVDWEIPGYKSFTAFSGKIDTEESKFLKLNWFLSLENADNFTRHNNSGLSLLSRSIHDNYSFEIKSTNLPFPISLFS